LGSRIKLKMAVKDKVCKNCGYLTTEDKCPNCDSNAFLEKYKGKVLVFDAKSSVVAKKLEIKNNGKYALKYN